MSKPQSAGTTSTAADEALVQQLGEVIEQIGVARFVSRLSAGLLDQTAGYQALGQYVIKQEKRPLLSQVTDVLFHRNSPN